ncbi:hypothetical protein ACMFMF_005647 [Clarireedia jacksonii]
METLWNSRIAKQMKFLARRKSSKSLYSELKNEFWKQIASHFSRKTTPHRSHHFLIARIVFNHLKLDEVPVSQSMPTTGASNEEKVPEAVTTAGLPSSQPRSETDSELVHKEFQHGVQAAEAIN